MDEKKEDPTAPPNMPPPYEAQQAYGTQAGCAPPYAPPQPAYAPQGYPAQPGYPSQGYPGHPGYPPAGAPAQPGYAPGPYPGENFLRFSNAIILSNRQSQVSKCVLANSSFLVVEFNIEVCVVPFFHSIPLIYL